MPNKAAGRRVAAWRNDRILGNESSLQSRATYHGH